MWISLEKGECFDFNHCLGCVYPALYIIRVLCRVYHSSLLICYPCSSQYLTRHQEWVNEILDNFNGYENIPKNH